MWCWICFPICGKELLRRLLAMFICFELVEDPVPSGSDKKAKLIVTSFFLPGTVFIGCGNKVQDSKKDWKWGIFCSWAVRKTELTAKKQSLYKCWNHMAPFCTGLYFFISFKTNSNYSVLHLFFINVNDYRRCYTMENQDLDSELSRELGSNT